MIWKMIYLELNKCIETTFQTENKTTFSYGNHYGWCILHRKKNKLICNVFLEDGAFSVMIFLAKKQMFNLYNNLSEMEKKCRLFLGSYSY